MRKQSKTGVRPRAVAGKSAKASGKELIILTGISGAGKASALKAFEDLGYQAVDNLPGYPELKFSFLDANRRAMKERQRLVELAGGLVAHREIE